MKDLNIIVKADVQGSAEAVKASLEKLTNEEVRVRVIHNGVGGINEGNFEVQRNSELRSEMQNAVSSVNSLSRLGSSSTSGMLGRVRQYVHGVEVINDLNVSMYGEIGRLYPQSVFDNIYAIIEEYEAKLSSGQKVSDTLTALSEAVNDLNERTYLVLGIQDAPADE